MFAFGPYFDLKTNGCHTSSLWMRAAASNIPYYRRIAAGGIHVSMQSHI